MDNNQAYYKAQRDRIQRTADMKKQQPNMSWEEAQRLADNVYALECDIASKPYNIKR